MKILIIGLPDQVKDVDLKEVQQKVSNLLDIPIKMMVINQTAILDCALQEKDNDEVLKNSKFVLAVETVMKALNYDNIQEPGVRGEFYTLVLKGIIERPIIEKIAFGPQNQQEFQYLQKKKYGKLVEYAKVALTL